MKTTLVLAAALAVLAPACRAQTLAGEAAGRRSVLAAWIMRGVGSIHDAADLKGSRAVLRPGAWPSGGRVKSLTMKGEACLQYAEAAASLPRLAAEARRRESLFAQAKALAAISGGSEDLELSMSRLDDRRNGALVDWALAQRRADDLRSLLLDAKWASVSGSATALDAGWGEDIAREK